MGRGDRVFFRASLQTPVHFRINGQPSLEKGFTSDISSKGIGLLTQKPVDKGSVLSLELKLPGVWKKIHLQGQVMHQLEKTGLPKSCKYLHGIQFADTDDNSQQKIGDFIARWTSFLGERWLVILLGLGIFIQFLLRGFLYEIFGMFQDSPFGQEWLPGAKDPVPWSLLGYLHICMGFLWIWGCVSFYFVKRYAAWMMIGLCFTVSAIQGCRFFMKLGNFGLGWKDWNILIMEAFFLLAGIVLLFAILRVRARFEAYLHSLQDEVRFQDAKN